MRLIYARYNPQCNSIDVTTFENVVLRIDCNKALDGEMQVWVDAEDRLDTW